MRSGKHLQQLRARLVAERESLAGLSSTAEAARKPVELDQQSVGRLSRMDAMQVQAMAIESERRRQQRMRRIDATIGRIDKGEYGACVRCGDDIPEQRLEADPTIPLCAECVRESSA